MILADAYMNKLRNYYVAHEKVDNIYSKTMHTFYASKVDASFVKR